METPSPSPGSPLLHPGGGAIGAVGEGQRQRETALVLGALQTQEKALLTPPCGGDRMREGGSSALILRDDICALAPVL